MQPFIYCLNSSTVRGQDLNLSDEIQVTANAGYDGIELWVREIDAFTASGGEVSSIKAMLSDCGLQVPNLIGFFTWAADDAGLRAGGLEEARRNMALCSAIGCPYLAAPPFGVTDKSIPVSALVDRYGDLLELGRRFDVKPMLEFWGISKTLGNLKDSMDVVRQVNDKDACVLADIFHMAKGGSSFDDLRLMDCDQLGLLHLNDYPSRPMDELTDADRLYPGDGSAPLVKVLSSLHTIGYSGVLSVELFNQQYWQHEALDVAATALQKTQKLVNTSISLINPTNGL